MAHTLARAKRARRPGTEPASHGDRQTTAIYQVDSQPLGGAVAALHVPVPLP